VTSSPTHAAQVGALSLLVAAATAGATTQPPDALSKLKHEGRISCQPSLPYFCSNMHVSCAGQTTLSTFTFSLRVTPSGGALEAPPGNETIVERYADSQLEWSNDGLYLIVRPAWSSGYIKLFRDGRYVFRHYPLHEGVMSLGTCA
jgi:hypothetical protein